MSATFPEMACSRAIVSLPMEEGQRTAAVFGVDSLSGATLWSRGNRAEPWRRVPSQGSTFLPAALALLISCSSAAALAQSITADNSLSVNSIVKTSPQANGASLYMITGGTLRGGANQYLFHSFKIGRAHV